MPTIRSIACWLTMLYIASANQLKHCARLRSGGVVNAFCHHCQVPMPSQRRISLSHCAFILPWFLVSVTHQKHTRTHYIPPNDVEWCSIYSLCYDTFLNPFRLWLDVSSLRRGGCIALYTTTYPYNLVLALVCLSKPLCSYVIYDEWHGFSGRYKWILV